MRCTKMSYFNLLLTVFSRIPDETYIVQIVGFLIYKIVFYPSTNCNELCWQWQYSVNAYLHCQSYHKFQNMDNYLVRKKYTVKLKRKSLDDKKVSLISSQPGAQYVTSFMESQSKQILVRYWSLCHTFKYIILLNKHTHILLSVGHLS